VVDLLDYDVRFGQGFLFSPPRPVRAEALQGAEPTKPDTAAADQTKRDPALARSTLAQLVRTGGLRS
jgi:cyclic-di-GMP phosphodiesterase, flagellum assembly factor TipF